MGSVPHPARVALAASLWAAGLLGGAACAPTLNVVAYHPGSIEPRGADTLVLVDGEGDREGRDKMPRIVRRQAAGTWWRVDDERGAGVKMALTGERAQLVGTRGLTLSPRELWARVDVVEWDVEDTTLIEQDEGGPVEVSARQAEVKLQVTIADRDGNVLLREEQYAASDTLEEGVVLLYDPLVEAAEEAARTFLVHTSPQRQVEGVRLDDSDSALRSLVDGLVKGTISPRKGERRLRRYLKKNATSAVALYNLAVVLDAQGKHEAALERYDAAMKIYTRDYYRDARDGCARRVAAKLAVHGVPATPAAVAVPAAPPPDPAASPAAGDPADPAAPLTGP